MDHIDRKLLTQLQHDATTPYAALGEAVGLSPGAAHERVRKLRERGVIRRTTVELDPAAVDSPVLAYVMITSSAWMGDSAAEFAAIPEILEAHIVAGSATVLVKVRTTTTRQLQDVLRRIYAIEAVRTTEATIVLETLVDRPVSPWPPPTDPPRRPDPGDRTSRVPPRSRSPRAPDGDRCAEAAHRA